jgi:hypothetical protein
MEDVGIFYGHFWYIFSVLVWCTKKNLAALWPDRAQAQANAGLHFGLGLRTWPQDQAHFYYTSPQARKSLIQAHIFQARPGPSFYKSILIVA